MSAQKLSPTSARPNTPSSPEPTVASLIESSEVPPHTYDASLDTAIHDFLHPTFFGTPYSHWESAIEQCIKRKEGTVLQWLSRRHDMKAIGILQPDAKVPLPLLNASEISWICTWNQERALPVPIDISLTITQGNPPPADLDAMVDMLAAPGLVTSLTITIAGPLACAKIVADALTRSHTLQRLIFSSLTWEKKDAALWDALAKNVGIEELTLYSVRGCSSEDAQALCHLLKTDKLRALDLSYTRFKTSSSSKNGNPLEAPRNGASELIGKQLDRTPDAMTSILGVISTNRSLRKLVLTGWAITGEIAQALEPVLKDCRFSELQLGPIPVQGYEEISARLKAALDANLSLCVFGSDDLEVRQAGMKVVERNRRRIQQQVAQLGQLTPPAVTALAKAQSVEIPPDLAGLIASMLPVPSQLALVEATFRRPTSQEQANT
jgi:hypothetical protein